MMAYVDPSGNIPSVPQEPGNRKKVLVQNIQIGTLKQEEVESEMVRKVDKPIGLTFYRQFSFLKD